MFLVAKTMTISDAESGKDCQINLRHPLPLRPTAITKCNEYERFIDQNEWSKSMGEKIASK